MEVEQTNFVTHLIITVQLNYWLPKNPSVKVARYRFLSEYPSRLSVDYVAINKDLEKLTPQLY